MISILISMGVAWATCTPPAFKAEDTRLRARAAALGHVSIEIPLIGSASPPEEILTVLNDRDLHTTLLPTRTWATLHGEFLRKAVASGHDVGMWFSLREDLGLTAERSSDPQFSDWISALRRSRKGIRKITGVRPTAVGIMYLPATGEIAMESMGFRTIFPTERTIEDLPRRARSTTNTAGRARIIGHGPYDDGCGNLLPHWSASSLDRATGAAATAH